MSHIVSSSADTSAKRELMIFSLRTAAAKAKLELETLENICAHIRQRAITCGQAHEWLKREGLAHRVEVQR